MPNLGKYFDAVMGAYVVALALIAAIVILSLWRGARVKRQLSEIEKRHKKHG